MVEVGLVIDDDGAGHLPGLGDADLFEKESEVAQHFSLPVNGFPAVIFHAEGFQITAREVKQPLRVVGRQPAVTMEGERIHFPFSGLPAATKERLLAAKQLNKSALACVMGE